MERSETMTKQIMDILTAAIAIAVGLPRDWPRRPHQDF